MALHSSYRSRKMIILQGVPIHTCRKLALSLKPKIGEPEINLFRKILQKSDY